MLEDVEAAYRIQPAGLEEILDGVGAGGQGAPARGQVGDCSVGIVDISLDHRTRIVGDGGDVPVRVLLEPNAASKAAAVGLVVAEDKGVLMN